MGTLDKFRSGASSAARGLAGALRTGLKRPPHASGHAPSLQLPPWYRPHPAPETLAALSSGQPAFLYMPWIAEHTDALIARLPRSQDVRLVASDMFLGLSDDPTRREIFRVALEETELYRRLVQRRLVQLRPYLAGVIFTFDWAPVTRVVAEVARDLSLPRILIPHESVFIHRDKYYWCANGKASVPVSDLILGWGGLQKDIFTDRGYPAERFESVGAPKFDPYADYRPILDRAGFCRLYGLDPARKLILFATQPLDSQIDTAMALKVQQRAVADILDAAEARGCQVLIRLPPSKDETLGAELRARLRRSPLAAVDEAQCYLVPPEEALFHADIVTSINSTMLFEAALLGRPAVSLKYLEFDQLWAQVGIPAVRDAAELSGLLERMLAQGFAYPPEGLSWAADRFGIGCFDGGASARISSVLGEIARGERVVTPLKAPRQRLLDGEGIDIVAVPAVAELAPEAVPHLLGLLRARTRATTPASARNLRTVASADIFLQWGAAAQGVQAVQAEIARALGRAVVTVERGLIGTRGPMCALLLDGADEAGSLLQHLQHGPELSAREHERAEALAARIVADRLTPWGAEAARPLALGTPGRGKVLVLEPAPDDPALRAGASLAAMIEQARAAHPGRDILLRRAPRPGSPAGQEGPRLPPDVLAVPADAGLHDAFDLADEVYVASDAVGLLALLKGRRVHVFGAPFYAGWGLTRDPGAARVPRARERTLADLVHAALIRNARYVHPETGEMLSVEDFLHHIARCG